MECELVTGNLFFCCKLFRFPDEHVGNVFCGFINRENRFHMCFWDDQEVCGGFRVDIREDDTIAILVEDFGLHLVSSDFAEKAVGHVISILC